MPRLLILCKILTSPALGRHGGTEIERLVVQLRLNFTGTGRPSGSTSTWTSIK